MKSKTRQADELLAIPMFCATVWMLWFFALTVQEMMTRPEYHNPLRMFIFTWLCLGTYVVFWAEAALHFILDSPRKWATLIDCVFPPLRLARRDLQSGTRMWLPILGWRHIDEHLHREVERALSYPMIAVALMILPLLLLDFKWSEMLDGNRWLQVVVETGFSITWMAFTMEFIVMFSIVDKKFNYLKTHWIDLAIILLPLIAFLRVFRLSQLLRLQQVTKVTRMYRMRGLGMRAWRGLLALNVITRLLRVSPASRIRSLKDQIEEREREIRYLQAEINRIEIECADKLAKQQSKLRGTADDEPLAEGEPA